MRVLITGAGGQLGHELARRLTDDTVLALTRERLDVTREPAVVAAVRDFGPDVVVHAAAFTKVDACETEAERAWAVNAQGTWWVARACALGEAALVYLSTDYVFDGTATRPYTEFDATNPQSVYGRTKEAGEQLVRATLREHYIVRTSWLQGVHGHSFAATMLRLAGEGRPLRVVDDQTGTPTFAADLAPVLRRLAVSGRYGTYHLSNQGATTWYGFAREIFAQAGVEADLAPTTTAAYEAPARRPAYSVLENRMAALAGLPPLPDWRESLGQLLAELRKGP